MSTDRPGVGLGDRLVVPAHVVIRDFPAETVVLNIRTGQYHGLDPVGASMLRTIQTVGSLATAFDELCVVFEDVDSEQLRSDLVEFCSGLIERGLLEAN